MLGGGWFLAERGEFSFCGSEECLSDDGALRECRDLLTEAGDHDVSWNGAVHGYPHAMKKIRTLVLFTVPPAAA